MGEENILYVPNLLTSLEAKERHNKIALNYFNRTPTIGNIYNGVVNWLKGHNVLTAEGTGVLTGEVPIPGMRNPKQITNEVTKIKSIAERAAKISDKIWDKLYFKAINSNNSKRILAIRDLHFKAKTNINKPYMFTHETDSKFNSFDIDRTGLNFLMELSGRNGKGVYLTLYMEDFSPEEVASFKGIWGDNVMPLRVYFKSPEKTNRVYHILSSPNYDGYIYNGNVSGEAFIRNPKKIKSAFAITYDDKGKIIPISLRDNFKINDIRYKEGGKIDLLLFLRKGKSIKVKNYPVVDALSEGLEDWFKLNPEVAGMAIGKGLNGIKGKRRIVINPFSNALQTEEQKKGLVLLESVRHAMDKHKYHPNFELTPTLKNLQLTKFKDLNLPYAYDDEAFKQSIISRILVGDDWDLDVSKELLEEAKKFKFK